MADVETHVLRFWETEFAALKPGKSRSGQRTYARKDVELVLRIRDLLYEDGYTIAGARRQLRRSAAAAEDPLKHPRVKGLGDRIRKEVEDLLRLVED